VLVARHLSLLMLRHFGKGTDARFDNLVDRHPGGDHGHKVLAVSWEVDCEEQITLGSRVEMAKAAFREGGAEKD
jgi:hypothetical protein